MKTPTMHIWFANAIDAIIGEEFGYMRGADIASTLARSGYRVTWIVPSFSHGLKAQRVPGARPNDDGIELQIVPTCAYGSNLSAARFRSYLQFGKGIYNLARRLDSPDLILAALPTPFADVACGRLASRLGIPLIADFRDLWPESFAAHIPHQLQWAESLILKPWYAMRAFALNRLSGLVSINESYLHHLQHLHPALREIPYKVIYDGVDPRIAVDQRSTSQEGLKLRSTKQREEIWVIYAGMLSTNHDVHTLLDAARIIEKDASRLKIRIFISGKGPLEGMVRAAERNNSLLTYLGVVPGETLRSYYSVTDIGLATSAPESAVVMPAKVFDYLGARLPVITSIGGDLSAWLKLYDFGVIYQAGDASSLANAIVSLSHSGQERKRLSTNAGKAATNFVRANLYEGFPEIVAEVLSVREGKRRGDLVTRHAC